MSKRIYVIVNQSAGRPEEAESLLSEALEACDLTYRLVEVKTPPEAYELARKLRPDDWDAVAVYGGDGTVIAVYKAVYDKRLPVIILPGGTANALASDLRLGDDIAEIIRMYAQGHYVLRYVDIALAGGRPFVLDLHFGAWTEAISQTATGTKRRFGRWAYYYSAISLAASLQPYQYRLELDGVTIETSAYALVIANGGYQNVLGVPFFPQAHGRGVLQVALIRHISLWRIVRWLLLKAIFGVSDESVISTHRVKQIVVRQAPGEMVFDDAHMKVVLPLTVSVAPESVMTVAPATPTDTGWRKHWLSLQLLFTRTSDHLSRMISGRPNLATSHVAPGLYLGGQYRAGGVRLLASWGVTGIINMRERSLVKIPASMAYLHLPTPDWEPPTLEAFRDGVEFIRSHIKAGGSVYVHCRQGEGRGPSMAAAYLISRGMRVEDALAHLRRYRPFSRPNQKQVRQLARWQDECLAVDPSADE